MIILKSFHCIVSKYYLIFLHENLLLQKFYINKYIRLILKIRSTVSMCNLIKKSGIVLLVTSFALNLQEAG